MAWLRHAPRHIHRTIVEHVTDNLDTLGWTGLTPPFGAVQVRIQTFMPPESELTKITPGLVAITLGSEYDADEEELGGPLHSQELPFFIDCFMDKDAHALALATDVRDILRGRFAGSKRSMPVMDYTDDPAVPAAGWRIEFMDIEREQIYRLPVYWQAVRATAYIEFPEEVY